MRRRIGIGAVCVAVLSMPIFADDLNPPDWRGLPGSTTQEWDFLTGGTPPLVTKDGPFQAYYPAPDGTGGITNNPYGDAGLYVLTGTYLPDTGWSEGGAWDNPVTDILVPNRPESDLFKLVRIQVTFFDGDGTCTPPAIEVGEETPGTWQQIGCMGYYLGDGWYTYVWDARIEPNPMNEVFFVDVPDGQEEWMYSEVIVDTICIPEPGALALLAVGGLALIRRRR